MRVIGLCIAAIFLGIASYIVSVGMFGAPMWAGWVISAVIGGIIGYMA